jgi:hypothetical protein
MGEAKHHRHSGGEKALAHEKYDHDDWDSRCHDSAGANNESLSTRVQFSPWKTLYCPSWETASFPRHLSGLPKKKQEQRFTCEPHTPQAGTSRPREKNPRTQNTSHERVNISKKTMSARRRPVPDDFSYLFPTPPILSSLSAFSSPGCVQKKGGIEVFILFSGVQIWRRRWHGMGARARARERERGHSQNIRERRIFLIVGVIFFLFSRGERGRGRRGEERKTPCPFVFSLVFSGFGYTPSFSRFSFFSVTAGFFDIPSTQE